METDYNKKRIFGSIDKNKVPGPLTDYTCEFIIEEYATGLHSITTNFSFKFTPKKDVEFTPFTIQVDEILQPKNLILPYLFIEKNGEAPIMHLGDKQQYKMQTTVKLPAKPESNLVRIEQSEDEAYPDDDLEVKVLDLGGDSLNDGESSSSHEKCFEPSEGDKGKIKAELIQYLHDDDKRTAKLKDVRIFLKAKGFKIAENRIKQILSDICKPMSDKKAGYVLKDMYVQRDEYERRNPRKKNKLD